MPRGETARKKTLKWWSTYGEIVVMERLWRSANESYLRPFTKSIGVRTRGCSMPLERALSDFGHEHSFQKAVGRLNEHYGFELSAGSIARVTLKHAKQIRKSQKKARTASLLRTCPSVQDL